MATMDAAKPAAGPGTVTPVFGLHVGGERTRVDKNDVDTIIIPRFTEQIQSKHHKKKAIKCNMLDISCRSWPFESLHHFFEQLRAIPYHSTSASSSILLSHIKVLQMDDIIASLMTDEGLQCMEYISKLFTGIYNDKSDTSSSDSACSLIELHCSDNAIGTRGLLKLQSILSISSLRRIYMNNCGLSAEVGKMLHDILFPVAHQLEILHLNRNQMGVQGCIELSPLLSNCTSLQSFSYAGTRPLKEGTLAICQGLANMVKNSLVKRADDEIGSPPVLSYLNLDDCQIKSGKDPDDPIHVLCSQVLNRCCFLTTLILRDCSLQAHGIQMVCDALSTSRASLQYLDVGCNEIGPSGANILTNYILQSPLKDGLRTLICDTNDFDNACCIDLLCTNVLQSCSSIQCINIQCNDVTDLSTLCNIVLPNHLSEKIIIDLKDNTELKLSHVRRIQKIVEQKYSIALLYDEDDLDDDDEEEEDDENELDDNDENSNAMNNAEEPFNDQLNAMMANVHI